MDFFKRLFKKPVKQRSHKELERIYTRKRYEVMPVLPADVKEVEKILNNYEVFPAMLVPKQYMKKLPNENLVFGHVVMLWWLHEVNRKNVPSYFIYQYGIDFNEELVFLKGNDLVNNQNNLTKKGLLTLEKHQDIIRKHKAKKSFKSNGQIEYHYEDSKATKNIDTFVSSGDYLEDQRLGASFEKNKDYDNAILAYQSAIQNAKKEGDIPPNPFMRLAIIYRRLKDKDKEIEILKKGIKLTSYPGAKTTNSKMVTRLKKLETRK